MPDRAGTATQLSQESAAVSTHTPVGDRTRLVGLLIVLAVAVVPLLISSTVHALGIAAQTSAQFLNYRFLNMLVQEVTSLALLLYVLNRNGQSLGNLGFNFRARDVLHGIALIVGTWFIFQISRSVAVQVYEFAFGHPPPSAISPLRAAGVTVATLLVVAVNPFFEELIVRAFLIAEATLLTGSVAFAIAISVSLQTSYHLYQGIPNATGLGFVFLVFSIYYVRTRRLWPIIIAHLWSDLSALLLYSVHVHR